MCLFQFILSRTSAKPALGSCASCGQSRRLIQQSLCCSPQITCTNELCFDDICRVCAVCVTGRQRDTSEHHEFQRQQPCCNAQSQQHLISCESSKEQSNKYWRCNGDGDRQRNAWRNKCTVLTTRRICTNIVRQSDQTNNKKVPNNT